MIFGIIIFILVCLAIYFIKKYNIKVNFESFNHKGVRYIDDRFGVYLITGKQGSNKTYYAVQLLLNQNRSKVNYILTNIKSLKIDGYEIRYFTKLKEILDNTDKNVIVVCDELSKKYKKNSATDEAFFGFLNQCRKNNRIFIGITQEYLELPMWLRRPCRYMLSNEPIPLLSKLFNVFRMNVGDGYNLTYDKDMAEYICPPISTIIYKRNQKVASMYDTREPIQEL